MRAAINGYGRIGRCLLRAAHERSLGDRLEIVAINEIANLETMAYLSRYDSTHGRFPGLIESTEGELRIDGRSLRVSHHSALEALDWGADADVDGTVVFGINHHGLGAGQSVISAASCTTNCIVPVIDVLERAFGVETGVITTIHSAMNDQPVIDSYHNTNLRLTRSALQSIIPVETGLARGIQRILPQLTDRFQCLHLRVPTINVSLMDLSVNVKTETSVGAVNQIFQDASQGDFAGLLAYTEDAHASVDFNTDPHSAIIDATQTRVCGGSLVKMICWFDNEWGFANRMLDVGHRWLELAGGDEGRR